MFNFKSLKFKTLLLLLIPAFSMFYFSSKFMYENYQNKQNANQIHQQIKALKITSNLIHELQKERGLNAAFLGLSNKSTISKLKQQNQKIDIEIKRYTSYFIKDNLIKINLQKDIFEYLDKIKPYQVSIYTKKVKFDNEISFYSKLISKLINSIPPPKRTKFNTSIINKFEAIYNLIYLKEYAGIERAYLSNIFAQDKLTIKQLKDIQKIYIQQELYYKAFIRHIPKNLYILYKQQISQNLEMQLGVFRGIILDSHKTSNFEIDTLIWYDIATRRIDKLNNILDLILNDITQEIQQNKKSATRALLLSIVLWIATLLAFLIIWYTIYKLIKLGQQNISKLEHQQKSYSAISSISNSIAYIDNDKSLYHNLCKTLLDIDGFSTAWVATVDTKSKKLIPYIAENIEIHKLEKIDFDIASNQISKDMTTPQKAYILDNYVIANRADIDLISMCDNIIDSSIYTVASFPIYLDKQIVSILTLFSTQKDIFDIKLIELIEKLLKDTSISLKFLELRENEKKILNELHIASYAFESQEAMTITDAHANIIKVNKAFEEITGYKEEEVLGHNPNILRSDKQSSEFYASMWKELKEKGKWKGEIYNKRKNGQIYPEMLSITAIKDEHNEVTHYIAQFLDISNIKRLQKDAEFRAEHDPLTSLTNRSKLKNETQKAFLYGKEKHIQHAFFFLDIDNFKYINDFYGHATGDSILIEIASRLKGCAKDGDIVARLGGDEFAMLSINIGKEELESVQQATQIAKIIQKSMKTPIIVDGHPFDITFSIGVKIFPNHENGYEEVISHADIAMYKAKKSGKNNFAFFDTELDIELKQFSLLEKEIKQALVNREFKLYYQPKVDIKTNKMIGMEALVRWSHPKKGLISPDKFLQVVTDTKNMYALETILIEQIFSQISSWKKEFGSFPYNVAINITPESFQNDNFIPFIKNCIKKYDVNASNLELELVENTFVSNMTQAIGKIKILKSLGIKFAIDDFGTGYSSLTYLQKLPIDSIKIDKSFIFDIENKSNREIIKMIINFAKLFELKVVAEGVENLKTLEFLQSFECDYYQGYYFSRAIKAEDISLLISKK